jgi:hypothetical protein
MSQRKDKVVFRRVLQELKVNKKDEFVSLNPQYGDEEEAYNRSVYQNSELISRREIDPDNDEHGNYDHNLGGYQYEDERERIVNGKYKRTYHRRQRPFTTEERIDNYMTAGKKLYKKIKKKVLK